MTKVVVGIRMCLALGALVACSKKEESPTLAEDCSLVPCDSATVRIDTGFPSRNAPGRIEYPAPYPRRVEHPDAPPKRIEYPASPQEPAEEDPDLRAHSQKRVDYPSSTDSVDPLGRLMPAAISLQGPDTLFIGIPMSITVVIDATVTGRGVPRGRQVHPDTTRVAPRTQVCLTAPGFEIGNEAGEKSNCREQAVTLAMPSEWEWSIEALGEKIHRSGMRQLTITVNALAPGFPPQTVAKRHHKAYVYVEAPSTLAELNEFFAQWQVLLGTLGAIVVTVGPWLAWVRKNRKTRDRNDDE